MPSDADTDKPQAPTNGDGVLGGNSRVPNAYLYTQERSARVAILKLHCCLDSSESFFDWTSCLDDFEVGCADDSEIVFVVDRV
jgi:hypothetical protein